MKTFKNKKGFTLIELLAVIVVLAIVMVLATTTVLPYMSKARQIAFATEANSAINAASEAMTLVSLGSISSDKLTGAEDYSNTNADGNQKVCFSLKKLIELGLLKKDISDLGADKYEGYVLVVNPANSNAYTYHVKMHNDSLYVDKQGGTVKGDSGDDIQNYTKSESTGDTYNCKNAASS